MRIPKHHFLILLLPLAWPGIGHADQAKWSAGMEYFSWREYFTSCPQVLEERGPRFFLEYDSLNRHNDNLDLAISNRFYAGFVQYDGFYQTCAPLTATTTYLGTRADVTTVYWLRNDNEAPRQLEYGATASVALDAWRRTIIDTGGYSEEYIVGSVFAGLAAIKHQQWFLRAGIKYPVIASETARLKAAGFSSDPVLHPKGSPSLYLDLELKNSNRYRTTIYYDSYRFNQSDSVNVSSCPPSYSACSVHQPTSHQDVVGFLLTRQF